GGAFAAIVPPMPGSGLAWDISGLTNGTLKVMTAPRPTITAITLSGANVVISGSNGVPNGPYYVLTTTNVAAPLANWTRLATNAFSASGSFSFTNAPVAAGQRFFALQLPSGEIACQ